MGRMKHLVGFLALVLLSGSLLNCANKTDESTYDCIQNTGLVFDGSSNYRDVNCSGIPNLIQIRLSSVTVPTGGELIIRPYSSTNADGFYVRIYDAGITTAAANGTSGAVTFTSGVNYTSAQNTCFEIHDVTKEKHILAYYQRQDCFGSASIDSANALVTFGENRVRYAGTTGVSIGEIHLKKTQSHSH